MCEVILLNAILLLQLQDFEAALKQRDGIITQLTANLQQAREEKDEIMKEFLELTEQSQKLQIQFQQVGTQIYDYYVLFIYSVLFTQLLFCTTACYPSA